MLKTSLFLFLLVLLNLPAQAQEEKGGPPPALVETSQIVKGSISPTTLFVGTINYPEVSEVAAEVQGRVEKVYIDDGMRVKKGQTMVSLGAELLVKSIKALEASQAQAAIETKKARLDAERFKKLYEEAAVSLQEYENYRYSMEGLSLKTAALAAQVEALKVQLAKKKIPAPFSGIITERKTEPGEWLEAGSVVATLARDDEVDIIVNIPEKVLNFLKPGLAVDFETSRGPGSGRIITIIPQGDVKTRTFPIKIRAANNIGMFAGMEAKVNLPSAQKEENFIVPRDALITQRGQNTVVLVENSAAKIVPVEVTSYSGLNAGITGQGLTEGALVVVKGNERLRPGQPVQIVSESK